MDIFGLMNLMHLCFNIIFSDRAAAVPDDAV